IRPRSESRGSRSADAGVAFVALRALTQHPRFLGVSLTLAGGNAAWRRSIEARTTSVFLPSLTKSNLAPGGGFVDLQAGLVAHERLRHGHGNRVGLQFRDFGCGLLRVRHRESSIRYFPDEDIRIRTPLHMLIKLATYFSTTGRPDESTGSGALGSLSKRYSKSDACSRRYS